MEKEIEDFIKQHKCQDEYYEGEQFGWYMYDDNVMKLIELVKNLNKPVVIKSVCEHDYKPVDFEGSEMITMKCIKCGTGY